MTTDNNPQSGPYREVVIIQRLNEIYFDGVF